MPIKQQQIENFGLSATPEGSLVGSVGEWVFTETGRIFYKATGAETNTGWIEFTSSVGGGSATLGTGTPEGSVTASPGELYVDTSGPTLYGKISGTGNTGWQVLSGTGSGGAPTGAAGGDLAGTYPNPLVAQLQGRPLANTAPNTNEVIGWNGSTWEPIAQTTDPAWTEVAHNPILTFDQNKTYAAFTLTGPTTYSLAGTGNVAGRMIVAQITTDGSHAVSFPAGANDTIYNHTNGDPLPAGTHEIYFFYKPNGGISTSIPGLQSDSSVRVIPFTSVIDLSQDTEYTANTATGTINFTKGANGQTGKVGLATITTDGTVEFNFSSDFEFIYGISSGVTPAAGTYEFYFLQKSSGNISVNVPGLSGSTGSGGSDTTAPSLLSAVVETANPNQIVLTYDETLDGSSVPAAADFSANGTSSGAKTITGVSISGSTLTLTASSNFETLETITVSYTAGTNPIQDISGNPSANLTNQAVVNNITDTYLIFGAPSNDSYFNLPTGVFDFVAAGQDQPFSIAVRFRGEAGDIFTDVAAGNFGKLIRVQASNPQFILYDNENHFIRLNGDVTQLLTTTQWYSIVFTYDGSESQNGINLYIDSVLDASPARSNSGVYDEIDAGVGNPIVGFNSISPSTGTGNLSEISFWNKELTQAEVTELYNGGNIFDLNTHSANANLLSYYKLDNNVLDSSGNNNHGTPSTNILFGT